MYITEVIKITPKLIQFFLQKIGVKFDSKKLKKIIDWGFIFSEKVIVKLDKLYFIYFNFYDEMIKNEIILADISREKKILHIGCGSIPATSILLIKKIGVQVTGIDKNPRSVDQARLCVLKTGVSDKIKILDGDAKIFPVETFDIIIVSQGVKPIKEILEHIAKSMKDDAYVIFRTSSSPNGEIDKNNLFIRDIFIIDKVIAQKKYALLISIMLSKRKT